MDGVLEQAGRDLKKEVFTLCDIGAGYGATLETAKYLKLTIDYFAYETSPGMRRNIKRMGGQVKKDFFSYDDPLQCDVVWASHILEHYPQPDVLLNGIKRHMKPGGIGFIEVPHLDCRYKSDWTQHLLFFSIPGLRRSIERNGFKILKIDSVGAVLQKLKVSQGASGKFNTLKVAIKKFMPTPLIHGQYCVRSFMRPFFPKRAPDVAEDLENKMVRDYWEMENYGGDDRCWIRAAFML